MTQNKLESFIEATVNNLSGFFIALGLWAFVVNPLLKSGYLNIDNSITITFIFFIVSMLRTYFWRRFFATGLHTTVHNILSRDNHV